MYVKVGECGMRSWFEICVIGLCMERGRWGREGEGRGRNSK